MDIFAAWAHGGNDSINMSNTSNSIYKCFDVKNHLNVSQFMLLVNHLNFYRG